MARSRQAEARHARQFTQDLREILAVFVRLTIQEANDGFRATLSRRDDDSKATIGDPETFLAKTKDEAKKRARQLARELGLPTYRVIDKAR